MPIKRPNEKPVDVLDNRTETPAIIAGSWKHLLFGEYPTEGELTEGVGISNASAVGPINYGQGGIRLQCTGGSGEISLWLCRQISFDESEGHIFGHAFKVAFSGGMVQAYVSGYGTSTEIEKNELLPEGEAKPTPAIAPGVYVEAAIYYVAPHYYLGAWVYSGGEWEQVLEILQTNEPPDGQVGFETAGTFRYLEAEYSGEGGEEGFSGEQPNANLPPKFLAEGTEPGILGHQDESLGEGFTPISFPAEGNVKCWTAMGLPEGLNINEETGVITGTYEKLEALHSSEITAEGPGGSATLKVTWEVVEWGPPILTNPGKQESEIEEPVDFRLPVSKVGLTSEWTATGLPEGLTISATGVIEGAPTKLGESTVKVTVKDSEGEATEEFVFKIIPESPPSLVKPANQTDEQHAEVELPIVAMHEGASPEWSAEDLPAALSINPSTGVITGEVTTIESPTVTVTLKTKAGMVSTTFTWTVTSDEVPTVNKPSEQHGYQGIKITPLKLTGTHDYEWLAEGLPMGLFINSKTGVVSGTPTTIEDYTVKVTAKNAVGEEDTTEFVWKILAPVIDVQDMIV